MTRDASYDAQLKACFGVEEAPAFSTRTLGDGELSATRIRCDATNNGLSNPLPREDAWLLTMQLTACPAHDLWIDGRAHRTAPLAAGVTSIYDLRADPRVNSVSPFMNIHFHLPMVALDAIAERDGFAGIAGFPHEPGVGIDDAVIKGLCLSLQPAFDRPHEVNGLFVDHVTQALAGYLTQRFGARRLPPPRTRTQLTTRQKRRAEALLMERLDGDLTVADLADAAGGLTPKEVTEGFAKATGELPHRWQMRRRIDKALYLMRTTSLPLEDIAVRCGFAHAPHMHRVLDQIYGRAAGASDY